MAILQRSLYAFAVVASALPSPTTLAAQADTTQRRRVFVIEQTQVQSPAIGHDGTILIGTGMPDTSLPSNGFYAINPRESSSDARG